MKNLSEIFSSEENFHRKHGKKVLIVEDDLFLAAIVGRAVHDLDVDSNIDWVTSLEQAFGKITAGIEKIGECPYELVIADVMLEGKGTGLDLWKIFCRIYPDVPVMIMSSLPQDQVFEAVKNESHTPPNFLKKPFSMGDLKTNIKEILA